MHGDEAAERMNASAMVQIDLLAAAVEGSLNPRRR